MALVTSLAANSSRACPERLAYHASTLNDYLRNIADAEAALGQGETP